MGGPHVRPSRRPLTAVPFASYVAINPPWKYPDDSRVMLLSSAADPAKLSAATPRWVVAECGDLRVGLSARQAREILEAPALTRVPGGEAVAGILSLRGRILPVFALDRLLGAAQANVERRPVVIVDVDGWGAGLMVDRVVAVAAASTKATGGGAGLPLGASGVGEYLDGTFIGLDAAVLLRGAFRTRQAEMESDGGWHARS